MTLRCYCEPMSNITRVMVLVTTLFIAIPACSPRHDGHAKEHHEHHTIVVTSPLVREVTVTQQYVGQIRSKQTIELKAMQEGYLEIITVKEGQAVVAGQTLFSVVPTLYKARLDAEVAEAKLAQLEVNNTQRLVDQNVVSTNELALLQAKLAKAQAKVKLAEAELAFTEIKAPFDGIIDRFQQQQGSLVKKEDVLTTLSNNSTMWVYFNVPEARYLEYLGGGKARLNWCLLTVASFRKPVRSVLLRPSSITRLEISLLEPTLPIRNGCCVTAKQEIF